MKIKEYINENLEEDIISKIYYNELDGLQKFPDDIEYIELTNKIRKMEKKLLKNAENSEIKKYMEYVNERTSIDAENQFKIGFKTAIKIILEAVK